MTDAPLADAESARPGYLPALDGLRAIAVLLVMWGHIPPVLQGYPEWLAALHAILQPGELGVEIFFVLSGFLITRILLAERRRGQPLRWFLLRRVLRIFPIFYLLIVVMVFVQPGPGLLWCAAYLSNVWFMTHEGNGMMGPTWSLCVEEHFYMAWPIVVAFAPSRWALRTMAFVILPAAVIGAFLVCLWVDLPLSDKIVRFGSPFRFFGLGVGCLMAFGEQGLRARPGRAALLGLGLVVLGVALWPVFWVFQAPGMLGIGLPPNLGPALWLVYSGTLCAGIVLCCLAGAFAKNSWVRPLATSLPRGIGRISYGLYLYHYPVYGLVITLGAPATALLAVAVTFAVATASYWLIERPVLRFGARFR